MRHRGTLLLVDDDRHVLESTAAWLSASGYRVLTAASVEEAEAQLRNHRVEVVVSDIRLADGDGFEVLRSCRCAEADRPVILVTGYGDLQTGISAVREGAFDLLTKPLLDAELEDSLERAFGRARAWRENRRLAEKLDRKFRPEEVVGRDPRMLQVFDLLERIADTKATVLITGESGTGKSVIARAIHNRSGRAKQPFVEVACGALPETLLETELFGHAAGAFTGSVGVKEGRFKQADRGTIFLDEVGTSSLAMQVKLLRVLQQLEFEPVGGAQTIKVDTRVILATNEDLASLMQQGRFRQDLYYRINVINIALPPLRERASDIRVLADHFLRRACQETGRSVDGIADEALAVLQTHQWPGNVRELENVIERAVLLTRGPRITVADLPSDVTSGHVDAPPAGATSTLKEALAGPERRIILEALEQNRWNRHQTADSLGINRTTLYKKMKRLGLEDLAAASSSAG